MTNYTTPIRIISGRLKGCTGKMCGNLSDLSAHITRVSVLVNGRITKVARSHIAQDDENQLGLFR